MTKSIWTDGELDTLARKLLFRFPGRGLDRVTQPHQIELNDLELTPLLREAIAPHRQALRPKLNRVKRDLVPALMRVTGRAGSLAPVPDTPAPAAPAPVRRASRTLKAAPQEVEATNPLPAPPAPPVEAVDAPAADPEPTLTQASGEEEDDEEAPAERRKGAKHRQSKIRWTDDEWRLCALALHTLAPTLNLVEARTEADLAGLSLRELNMAAGMMEEGRRRHFKWLKGPAARLLQEYARARRDRDPMYFGPDAAPVAPAAEPEPIPQQAPATTFSRAGEQRIFWTSAEWVEIAMEIDRLHPHARYAERGTTGALTVQDIVQAQRVLPVDRRRHLRTANMEKLREHLLQGLREVKALKAEAAAAKHAEALQAFEEKRAAATTPPPPNPWEQALRPAVELIAQQIAAQLLPMIVQALAGQPAGSTPATSTPIATVTSLLGHIGRAQEARPKKMSIGMVSGRSTYADDLNKTFPEVDFVFIESHNTRMVDSVKNCDRVILLTRFTSHSMQDRLKKVCGDRLVLVNGSVTDAKRVIHGLLHTQERKTA